MGKSWRVLDYRESITGIGVVWPVYESHGQCGCGRCEMGGPIAFFVDRYDAEMFVADKEYRRDIREHGAAVVQ